MARPFKFKHPDEVWKLYQNYLKHIANTPMYRNELIKSGERAGEQIPVRVDVPPNVWGFCLFANIDRVTYYKYLNAGENSNIDKEYFRCAVVAPRVLTIFIDFIFPIIRYII